MEKLIKIAENCGAKIQGNAEGIAKGVSTDSRTVGAGDVFVAIAGEKFDGHQFLDEVASKGVAAIVAEQGKVAAGWNRCPLILVSNTRIAYGQIAAAYRQSFNIPVTAVAGSNGKTTTKELIASVLGQKFSTLKSEASFNNDIGVPATMLKMTVKHQAAVLEVGTNHPGELAPLVKLIQPKFGVITSIGREHLEFFGDLVGVAQEEGSLAELLPADGRLFVNVDSPWMEHILRRATCPVVMVSQREKGDWNGKLVRSDLNGSEIEVTAPKEEYSGVYRIPLLGRHQITNALLALAVGAELGLSRAELKLGLAACPAPKMRLQVSERKGVTVLDDSYNANADSMLAALQTLVDLPCHGRRVAVIGDMAELGSSAAAAHAEVGRHAADLKIDGLLTVGRMGQVTASAAKVGGIPLVKECADTEVAAAELKQWLQPGDLLLVKASRSSRVERVLEALG
ncbi:MAG TPA: UDP-N-acetylmuramoyl-tripeptide--D-alanyl-D-alanine ligase [Verrucomicrobiae bacterium]